MPPASDSHPSPDQSPDDRSPEQTLQQVVDRVGLFPADAYVFVQAALYHTAEAVHGRREAVEVHDSDDAPHADRDGAAADPPTRHISGRQLCEGIRDFALARWGRMAHTVLGRWGLGETGDFGRIVFALVEAGLLSKTDDDRPEDFSGVFDFRRALETDYACPARLLDPEDDPVAGAGKPCKK